MSVWGQLVISNLLVASLIGCLAAVVGRTGRRARLAHGLWVFFFVKLVTPPIISLPLGLPSQWFVSIGEFASWHWLFLIWRFGFLLFVVLGLIRFVRFYRLLRREGQLDSESTSFVQSLVRSEAGRSTIVGPDVLRLPMRVSPMLFGFGSCPVIVCPDQLWQSLSEPERHAFLAHETAHFCRRDHWVRWLEWLVTAVYWWFPGVHLARAQLERHEEACCDAWAIRKLKTTPRQYAEALLRVVDFISDYRVGMPRLASAMQPTESLAERLRLLMRDRGADDSTTTMKSAIAALCVGIWLVHPVIHPRQPSLPRALKEIDVERLTADDLAVMAMKELPHLEAANLLLPDQPQGFWNQSPPHRWANFELTLPDAELTADAHCGITIEIPKHQPLHFPAHELTAMVEIPSTQRVVIGDANGQLRLWDLSAGTAVSLIGMHPSAITSLAYHDSVGLVSADATGSVIRWNLQSGQPLATWSNETSRIQSIRFSNDGQTLAILLGNWSSPASLQNLVLVDSHTFQSTRSVMVPANTAIVLCWPGDNWCTVDWSGVVHRLHDKSVILVLPKHRVSALALSQSAALDFSEISTP